MRSKADGPWWNAGPWETRFPVLSAADVVTPATTQRVPTHGPHNTHYKVVNQANLIRAAKVQRIQVG